MSYVFFYFSCNYIFTKVNLLFYLRAPIINFKDNNSLFCVKDFLYFAFFARRKFCCVSTKILIDFSSKFLCIMLHRKEIILKTKLLGNFSFLCSFIRSSHLMNYKLRKYFLHALFILMNSISKANTHCFHDENILFYIKSPFSIKCFVLYCVKPAVVYKMISIYNKDF